MSQPQINSCAACDAHQGRPYGFYYGKLVQRKTDFAGTTTSRYQMASTYTAWLCDRCVFKHRLWIAAKSLLLAACAGGSGVAIGVFGEEICGGLLFALMVLAGLGSLAMLWEAVSTSKDEIGDEKAIQLNREELESRGYDAFWTRKRYKKSS